MSLAFDKSAVVKEYQEQIKVLEKQSNELAKKVGTLTIERDWLAGCSKAKFPRAESLRTIYR